MNKNLTIRVAKRARNSAVHDWKGWLPENFNFSTICIPKSTELIFSEKQPPNSCLLYLEQKNVGH